MTIMNNVSFEDRINVPSARQLTDSGQMIVPCAFARTGVQSYTAGQLGLQDVASDKVVSVMRDEADVFDAASLSSFRSVPVTIGHPKTEQGLPLSVTSENSQELQVGVLEGMPTRDEDTLTGTLVIARQDAIDLIEDGTKELSAGYTCDLEVVDVEGEDSVIYQRNIRANHIAIVERGRAGAMCSIADEDNMDTQNETPEVIADEVEVAVEAVESEVVLSDVEAVVPSDVVEDEASDSVDAVEAEVEVAVVDEEVAVEEVAVEVADEVVAVINLEDELATVTASVATLNDELSEAAAKIATLQDELNASVEERVNVILIAKDLTDISDFSSKSISEIKTEVVANLLPKLVLSDRSEAYVSARFDILSEDAEIGETPMGRLLSDNATAVHKVAQPSTAVADARARATDRFKR